MKNTWSQGAHPTAGNGNGISWIFNPYLLLAFRLLLAAVFIYAAVHKLGKPNAFAEAIRGYGVVDYGPPLYIMAIVLPWIEILCALSLVTGVFIRGSALILLGMNALFLGVIAYRAAGIVRDGTPFMKVYFDCGCGFGATYAWKKLLEDAAYLLMSFAILAAPRHRFVVSIRRRSS
jgi:uncharacterized membrane protein YphA (DoxX/SURF4 family)